jgi:signal transduction histidine kinase
MAARNSRSVVPLALFVALLVVGLNTWFAVAAVKDLLESEAWLAHTWEVIGQQDRLLSDVTSAESAVRGFLTTGREDLLVTFGNIERSLPGDIQQVKDLTLDNDVQQKNVEDARQLIQHRMQMLRDVAQVRRAEGFEAAVRVASTGAGSAEMSRLRAVVAKMDIEERRLLSNRGEEARHNGQRSMFAIGLACVLDLTMIGLVTFYFIQERKLRMDSENQSELLVIANQIAEKSSQEVLELNRELEQRVWDRTAELETTNRELEAFSYSVSHDLRAPLRTIDGFSLALEEDYADAVDDVGRDYIQRVRAGVQRMGQLIDALLQLSRITRAEVSREAVDVAKLAEAVIVALRDEHPNRELNFTVTPGPLADADPKLVQVALENLLGNAVKFTGRKPYTEISFGWDVAAKAWRVSDNGAGFDMHYADRLFNAFNRLHGDKDFKGSGIGLATVARVIRRHHGRIWAESKVEHGATFWFTLG